MGDRIDTRGCVIHAEGFRFDVASTLPPMTLSRRSKGKAALRIAGRLEG